MDPLIEMLTNKYGLSPEQARTEAARMTGRASRPPVVTSIPDPKVTTIDSRGEYAKIFGTEPPDRATDLQVQQAVDAEMQRQLSRGPDGPPTHPVITDPNPESRIAYFNRLMGKQQAGQVLSDHEQDYLNRVERQRAMLALGALKYTTPAQDAGAAFDARYALEKRTRRALSATGLPPSLFPQAQAQAAGWTTPYQYPAPLAVPMKLEK